MNEITTRDKVRTLLGAQALVDAAGAQVKAMRLELLGDMGPGERTTIKADGEEVGKVWVTDPKARTVVEDSDAFLAWVREQHPDEVVMVPMVRPSYRDALIKAGGVDPETGEVVPGMAQTVGTPTMTVKPSDHGRQLAVNVLAGLLQIEDGVA